jgi:hypothetical protein
LAAHTGEEMRADLDVSHAVQNQRYIRYDAIQEAITA